MPLEAGTKNRSVQMFCSLNRSRAYREKNGAFALEGFRLVYDAACSGAELLFLLLTEKAQAQHGEALTAAAPGVRVLLISEALAKEIADTESAQGVFAAARQRTDEAPLPVHGQRVMLLHSVQDPNNLGAILRTAEALSTDGLFLYQCCDLYNPKTVRGSMGALLRIPLRRVKDLDAFLTHCREAEVPTCAAVVDRDAQLLGAFDFSGGACVLIGNEGNGLPAEVSRACTHRLTIPMSPASNSLNAAMAAGLFLWEMRKAVT